MDTIRNPVRGYETHYDVSDDGEVRRIISPCIMHRKLTDADARMIRCLDADGLSAAKIARAFKVSASAIAKVLHGETHRYSPTKLKTAINGCGYPFVVLSKNGKTRPMPVHRIVTAAFLGPCPQGLEVNHKDGNKLNARLDNLEYVTKSQNALHAVDQLGKSHKINRTQAETIRSLKGTCSRKELAQRFGISVHMVTAIWIGKAWAR